MNKEINQTLVFAENRYMETAHLLLRPVNLDDSKDMYEYASDEETTAFVFTTHDSLETTRQTIAEYFLAAPLGKYAIEWRQTNKMIGTIDLRVNPQQRTGEIGYTLNKLFWGQGITVEAAQRVLTLAFEEMDLVRVYAMHDLENPKSGRVMEKLGMTKLSEVAQAREMKGKVVGVATYGMSQSEWKTLRRMTK